MKIALIGGTGFVGAAILRELLFRNHLVTALARDPAKFSARAGLTAVEADVYDTTQVARAVVGHDAVISAFNPGWKEPDIHALFLKGHAAIVAGVKCAGVKRFLTVGGAGSLYVAPGVQGVDTPHFPAEWKAGALGARDALVEIQKETALDWTFISPPADLHPGARTGEYRLGGDNLLMNGAKPAGITDCDLAVAIVDEIETARHIRRRFTVANP